MYGLTPSEIILSEKFLYPLTHRNLKFNVQLNIPIYRLECNQYITLSSVVRQSQLSIFFATRLGYGTLTLAVFLDHDTLDA